IPRPAAVYWANTGADIPGAVPLEFLKIKVDLDTLAKALEEPDAAFLENSLFTGTLRQYQLAGVCWLKAMGERGCNVILADEMGLGKTIQSIALLAGAADKNLPALIVAPTSLVDNWEREIWKFAPSLRVVTIAGPDRKELWKNAMAADICLCSYALAKRDAETLRTFHFRYLILDEAQHIKNPSSINAQICKEIAADHKVVLTGTPLENSAEDLWSIFDFLHPGLLGSLRAFRARYADIAKNHELGKELSRIIAPFILRRKKSDVCAELPGKQEQALYCDMDNGQLELYRKYEAEARQRCSDLKNGGSRMEMLTALLRLRQICCDPALLGENHRSAKFELLQELLLESLDSGRKVLVFSQFTSMLKIIRTWLESAGIPYEYLDGSTKDRMERVDAFNSSPDIPVFLLSLKAGGLGLNLTTADTVILYDPWWNPAAEAQAMDRSHRIGQTRNVTCFKLFVRGSVEEKVLSLQKKKQDLFGALVEDSAAALGGMTLEDFEFLLK
ncbi:MAG: DEAD/DEAH box helicase, partial [Lentisphaeria bacterium]|nr:DEAD/DEAH box helicase [Lentisphaeria bacterium]